MLSDETEDPMAHFLAETDSVLDGALDELRQRLGLDEHQETDLLQKLAALASWVIQQAEAGRRIEAQEVLAQLEADPSQQLMTRIQLDDEQVRRLAEVLDRGYSPTPALRRLLASLADPDHRPPEPKWS
jgi:uncharacterized protein (DUF1778 family)